MSETINLGSVTAYASAVEGGYTGTYEEFCTAEANFANIAADITEALGAKADKVTSATNGNLASLDANGNLTDSGIPSVTTLSSTDPYTYRKSLGNLADMEIEGASVGWNQLAKNGNFATNTVWTSNSASLSIANNEATITLTGSEWNNDLRQAFNIPTGHVYLMSADIKMSGGLSSSELGFYIYTTRMGSRIPYSNSYKREYRVEKSSGEGSYFKIALATSGTNLSGESFSVKNVNLFDLTLLFNSTVADAIYAMEQATAGAGVAFFRKYFPKDYYAYDAGSIQSVCVGSRKVVTGNFLDESTLALQTYGANQRVGYSPLMLFAGTYTLSKQSGNITLYVKDYETTSTIATMSGSSISFTLESDKTVYIASSLTSLSSYTNSGVMLEKGSTATEYKPYNPILYPFDSTKELRGMFDLVGGELKANGDIYTADGNIQRKYGIVDLGTLTWSKNVNDMFSISHSSYGGKPSGTAVCAKYVYGGTTAVNLPDKQFSMGPNYLNFRDDSYTDAATFKTAMSGVYLVYELATPTTENAQPYQNPQRAYIDGTEEFTDGLTRDVMIPVGNNTTYQQDKILPSVEDYVDAVADNIDLSGKADKVANATNGHLAGLDANGNIKDSGIDPTSLGGAPKLDINPTSATIKNYPNGTLWLTSSNNEVNLFAKINGIKYTLQLEMRLDALKFSSDSDFTLSAPKKWDGILEYSIDNGNIWLEWNGSQLSGTVNQPIYLRGTGNSIISDGYQWTFTGKYCTGNIENLLDYQTVANGEHPIMANYCYNDMFNNCTSLAQAPELPATTLAGSCYRGMFDGCTSLAQAPELPATTLAAYCCYGMFNNCTSLAQAPELPATTLANGCYRSMFNGCTSLKFSTTQTGEYQYAYRIPTTGTGKTASNALTNMFTSTGGTFTDTPEINTTYYTTNQPV